MTAYPLLSRDDIVTRRTPCGEFRGSINVYAIQRRDGIDFRSATARAEAIACYDDSREDVEAAALRMIETANANRFQPI